MHGVSGQGASRQRRDATRPSQAKLTNCDDQRPIPRLDSPVMSGATPTPTGSLVDTPAVCYRSRTETHD